MRNIYSLMLLLLAAGSNAFAQTPVELHISHTLGGNAFAFGSTAQNDLGNDFSVSRLEYYISKIQITHDGGMTTDVPDHYILADGGQNVTDNLGSFNITNVEAVSFHIGVDTPVNNADPALQPPGHPLALKSPSMHWGWASGYRFVAMEGKSGPGLTQNYEIHALGNQHYFMTTVNVTGVTKGGKIIIPLHADYTKALKGMDMSAGMIAHGDGANEAKLLNNFKNEVFAAGDPVSVGTTVAANNEVNIYPNPAFSSGATISFAGNALAATISVINLEGRTVLQLHKNAGDNYVKVNGNNPGLYFVKILYADGSYISRKLQIQ